MDNIEKLKEKVDKDPTSKLFVPLAEEYRKAGLTDKAIDALKDGLQRQPGYMSARVSLGKIYLEKDMKREAKAEFEKVISAIPDNLFARRKLADIYRALGEKDRALEQYRTVLRLNPFDEEAIAYQRELEGARPPAGEGARPPAEAGPEAFSRQEAPAPTFPKVETFRSIGGFPTAQEPGEKEALFEGTGTEDVFGGLMAAEPKPEEPPFETVKGATDPRDKEEELLSVEDVFNNAGIEAFEEPELPEVIDEAEVLNIDALDQLVAEIGGGSAVEGAEGEDAVIVEEEAVGLDEEMTPEAIEALGVVPAGELFEELMEKEPADVQSDIYGADGLAADGKYLDAMSSYRSVLSREPDNMQVMQRVVELKSLLKMMGREADLFEANLQSFLDGIKRRRDEFSDSP